MKREDVLKRVNDKISQLEKILEARTEPLWSGVAVYAWKEDLEFYKHIRSIIEGKNKGG
jgi:hypothetical protein